MEDSSFPTQSVVSAHLSNGPIEVADCPVDSNFAYPCLKSYLSDLEFTLEFAIVTPSVLHPKSFTKTCNEHHVYMLMHVIECVDNFFVI